jgi:hypothetical protein
LSSRVPCVSDRDGFVEIVNEQTFQSSARTRGNICQVASWSAHVLRVHRTRSNRRCGYRSLLGLCTSNGRQLIRTWYLPNGRSSLTRPIENAGPVIGAQHCLVVENPTGHIERPDAELAHVAEGSSARSVQHRASSSPCSSSAASAARPSLVSVSRSAASRSIRPLTTMAVAIAPVTPARAHSVPEATQNSSTRSGTVSSAAIAASRFVGSIGSLKRGIEIAFRPA